jgi:hypothetical protein
VNSNYLVTITADASCASLPDAARSRVYSTFIDSRVVTGQIVTLAGSIFAPSQNGYPGTDWNVISMRLKDDFATLWFQDPPIWEGATIDTFVRIDGHAEGTFSSSQSDLAMWGSIEFCPSRDENYQCLAPVESCTSENHRLTLVRQ